MGRKPEAKAWADRIENWEQWKLPKTKLRNLRKAGLPDVLARPLAATRKGPWHISANGYLARALPSQYFTRTLGLVLLG